MWRLSSFQFLSTASFEPLSSSCLLLAFICPVLASFAWLLGSHTAFFATTPSLEFVLSNPFHHVYLPIDAELPSIFVP